MNDAAEIPARLALARRRAGLTQAIAAARCGVHRSTWAMWETGSRELKAARILAAARAVGVSAGWLVGEEPPSAIAGISENDLQEVASAARLITAVARRWSA